MIYIRSFVFNIAFYIFIIACIVGFSPLLLLPYENRKWIPKFWADGSLVLLKYIAGATMEVRGTENIPKGAALVASKHQSFWDIIALYSILEEPCQIAKKELFQIPLFNIYLWKFNQIQVDRKGGSTALKTLLKAAKNAINSRRPIVIYPEGTRSAPGVEPKYQSGVSLLYRGLNVITVPVALNSGCYWPRRGFIRTPGAVIIEFLPAIAPGLSSKDFMRELVDTIESKTNALVAKSVDQANRD